MRDRFSQGYCSNIARQSLLGGKLSGLIQNLIYSSPSLQVKIQQGGVWSAGICTPAADLSKDLGLDQSSWAVTSSGCVRTRGELEYTVSHNLEEGDVLGFSYDHVELNIFCNGKNLDTPILGIKGTVFPVFYGI